MYGQFVVFDGEKRFKESIKSALNVNSANNAVIFMTLAMCCIGVMSRAKVNTFNVSKRCCFWLVIFSIL